MSTKKSSKKPPNAQNRLSSRSYWRIYRLCLFISDSLLTGLAFWLAFRLRFEASVFIFQLHVIPSPTFYLQLALILIPLWILVYVITGLYRRENLLGGFKEYELIFRGTTASVLLVVLAGFLEPTFILARGWLLLSWGLTFALTAASRFVLRRVVYAQRQRGHFLSPAVIIGANEEGRLLAEQLWRWRTSGLYLVGVVCDEVPPGTPIYQQLQVLGPLSALDELIPTHGIEEIIIASSALTREKMLQVFERYGLSKQVNLRLTSGLFEVITTGLKIKEIGYVPLIRVDHMRLTGVNQTIKVFLDYGITIPVLVVLAPILLLLAIAVRLDSSGPAIHRRRVMGINGSQFDAFKFRTMHVNGDEILQQYPEKQAELAQNHKLKDDPRVTRVGQFLRKFSLDELPQFINVLRGEMSLVGPRIISPPEMAMYEHWSMNLLTVKPGITGLWQVSGRSDLAYDERVRLDMQYIRNWTIWLDLQLLIQTIPAVLRSKGAY